MAVTSLDSYYGNLLGNPSASKGGHARAKSLSAKRRREIAQTAAQTRWAKDEAERESIKSLKQNPEDILMLANYEKQPPKALLASINKPIRFFN